MADEWGEMIALSDTLHAIGQQRKPAKQTESSKRGEARQRQGAGSENKVRRVLEAMGIEYITRVKTYFSRGGRYAIKAEADFRGISAGGKYTLIEAKDITGDRLQHSRIADHQRANLNAVVKHGGVAYLAITHGEGREKKTAVLSWPVPGFKKGTSILWEDAMENRVN